MIVEIRYGELLKLTYSLGTDIADDHSARTGCNKADEPIKNRARYRQHENNGEYLCNTVEIDVALVDDKVDTVTDEDGDIVRHNGRHSGKNKRDNEKRNKSLCKSEQTSDNVLLLRFGKLGGFLILSHQFSPPYCVS